MVLFYLIAGINHFVNPDFYLPLIPDYLPAPILLNRVAGFAEIVLGVGLLFKVTRHLAAFGIIALLLALIPSHLYFIQIGSCIADGLCVPEWIAWLRLLLIHPLLVLWAYIYTNKTYHGKKYFWRRAHHL